MPSDLNAGLNITGVSASHAAVGGSHHVWSGLLQPCNQPFSYLQLTVLSAASNFDDQLAFYATAIHHIGMDLLRALMHIPPNNQSQQSSSSPPYKAP
jgi:hypothetical protein